MDEFDTQPITYKEFQEAFNAISDYHAYPAPNYWKAIGAAIVDPDGALMAVLYDGSYDWRFDTSTFNFRELILMARLAGTKPELRGEF